MKDTELLVVLGSPNSATGELSAIARSRLDVCVQLYHNKRRDILCTGGWGEQFNTTDLPHAEYAKRYLIEQKVDNKDILEPALSKNTVEDAVKIKEALVDLEHRDLIVITSDFHLERVQLIFNEILAEKKLTYIGAKCKLNSEDLIQLKEHESRAIESIKRNGLYY